MSSKSPVTKYGNSYKLNADNPFNVDRVQKILQRVLHDTVDDETRYEPETVANKAKLACGEIKDQVKEENFDRYKIVCIVTIGEKKPQDVHYIAKFLWDVERDKFCTYAHENMYVYIIGVVFGVYFE